MKLFMPVEWKPIGRAKRSRLRELADELVAAVIRAATHVFADRSVYEKPLRSRDDELIAAVRPVTPDNDLVNSLEDELKEDHSEGKRKRGYFNDDSNDSIRPTKHPRLMELNVEPVVPIIRFSESKSIELEECIRASKRPYLMELSVEPVVPMIRFAEKKKRDYFDDDFDEHARASKRTRFMEELADEPALENTMFSTIDMDYSICNSNRNDENDATLCGEAMDVDAPVALQSENHMYSTIDMDYSPYYGEAMDIDELPVAEQIENDMFSTIDMDYSLYYGEAMDIDELPVAEQIENDMFSTIDMDYSLYYGEAMDIDDEPVPQYDNMILG
jgi:hypothetical protein